MKRTSIVCLLAAAAGGLLLEQGTAWAQSSGRAPLPERYVLGRVLIQPRPGLSRAELENIVKSHGDYSPFTV